MGESIHPSSPGAERAIEVPFDAHVGLLRSFLTHREDIVGRIEALLNAQRKPFQYLQDVPLLSRHFSDCFFSLTGVTSDASRLRDQLEEAHWASGFRPRESPGLHNDLVDPADMMVRAFHLWQQTRWPGHSGRARYAETLFNLYVIRRLVLLNMRVWDAGSDSAGDRLSEVQVVLDALWKSSPADQPVLVRDARWLIPVAQSPTTDDLSGYLEVAKRVAGSLTEADRIEIHEASVRTGGGHLRSQLRHLSVEKGVPHDEPGLVLSTRTSNALDLALLIQGLVALLRAYQDAIESGDSPKRLKLADAICQGVSPDPELFLNRLDLLGPYSMIEHLFITTDRDGTVDYTPMGQRHVRLAREYEARIRRASGSLHEDCRHFRPVEGAYSPYGVLYGFSSNLFELIAFKSLERDAVTEFSMEDVFDSGDAAKLAWVSGWRKLPHIKPEVAKLFEYPQQFAEDMFRRVEDALGTFVSFDEEGSAASTGRLLVLAEGGLQVDSKLSQTPDLPVRYLRSSDAEIVAAHRAEPLDQRQLLRGRAEGEYLVSYETPGGWVAVSKDILTEVLGAGQDAKIVGMPDTAAGVLSLMGPDLVVLQER
jgi:hypothetical protein